MRYDLCFISSFDAEDSSVDEVVCHECRPVRDCRAGCIRIDRSVRVGFDSDLSHSLV
jgi:hypothetical protein